MQRYSLTRYASLALIGLILLLGPFYQGLFFQLPILAANTVLGVAFVLWLLGKRGDTVQIILGREWPERFLLLLIASYVIQFAWASYARGNLDWVLRAIGAWMVFAVVRNEINTRLRKYLGWTLMLASAVVAVLGLLEYSGFFLANPTLAQLLQVESLADGDRLYSVLQYPNTAAIMMLSTIVVANGLLLETTRMSTRIVAGTLTAATAIGLVLTLSRGVFVLAPVAVAMFWIGLPRHRLFPSFLTFAATVGIPVLIGLQTIPSSASSGDATMVVVWTAVGCIAAAGATAVVSYLEALSRPRGVLLVIGCLVVVGFVGLLAVFRVNGLSGSFSRLLDISLRSEHAQQRLEFARDGVKAFSLRPWGYGGGGWERVYLRVQSANYISRQAHNHYVQTLVEGGALGFAAILGALGTSVWMAFRQRGEDPMRWSATTAGALIALHAAVDIDLSYFYLWLLMWMLLAAGLSDKAEQPTRGRKQAPVAMLITVGLAFSLVSADLTAAAVAYDRATEALILGDNQKALQLSRTAVKLDPINSQYLSFIGSKETMERAAAVDPYEPSVWNTLSHFRMAEGDLVGALEAAYAALETQPMNVARYTRVAELASSLFDAAVEQGARELALSHAHRIVAIGRKLDERAHVAARSQHLYPYAKLEWNAVISLAVGKAHFLIGDLSVARSRLTEAVADEQVGEQASLWLQALTSKQGEEGGSRSTISEDAVRTSLYHALLEWKSQ